MTIKNTYNPPDELVNAILDGRCVAFVGAGFSASAIPGWKEFLLRLANKLPADRQTPVIDAINKSGSAFQFEVAGQMLRDQFTDAKEFGAAISELLNDKSNRGQIENRLSLLMGIPFEAILTTNYDAFLPGRQISPEVYSKILHERTGWWSYVNWDQMQKSPNSRIVKLHGGMGSDGEIHPVVLSRSDYRNLLYRDSRYANFLRTIFASRVVLFLGVSFTDAYLNELRSEIFALLRNSEESAQPLAYAIYNDLNDLETEYFLKHEGIKILPFNTKPDGKGGQQTWEGFDLWLQGIFNRTSSEARLKELIGNKKLIWVDQNPENNDYGVKRLKNLGVQVDILTLPEDLNEEYHGSAHILVTSYGHHDKVAGRVFDRLSSWRERPPVIVFASGVHAEENRMYALRRGAYEYAYTWNELFRLLEQLFGRKIGV